MMNIHFVVCSKCYLEEYKKCSYFTMKIKSQIHTMYFLQQQFSLTSVRPIYTILVPQNNQSCWCLIQRGIFQLAEAK